MSKEELERLLKRAKELGIVYFEADSFKFDSEVADDAFLKDNKIFDTEELKVILERAVKSAQKDGRHS